VRIAPALAPAALLLLALGCGGAEEVAPPAGKPVVVTEVEARDLEERIEGTGELLAKDRAEVAAQVAGEITAILFDEGEAVEEGAIVLEIDPERRNLELDRARARVEEARAGLGEARRQLKRTRSLAGQTFASKSQLDEAETAVATARSRLHAAEADLGVAERALRDASVTASFPGLIARRHVFRGEFVTAGQTLFELVSLDPIEVEFHLPEADSARVHRGIAVEVLVAPYPGEVFDATVTVISPTIDRRSRTLRVKALMRNADGRLRPGLFARVDLGIAHREGVLMVPEEAVLQRADGAVVFRLLEDQHVQRLVVETGVLRDGFIEIVKGLAPDDLVVARGHAELIDGAKIVARNADGTLAVSSGPRAAVETESEVLAP
jgi:membrane fusion protein (multidrug efflux system)